MNLDEFALIVRRDQANLLADVEKLIAVAKAADKYIDANLCFKCDYGSPDPCDCGYEELVTAVIFLGGE